MHSRLTLVGLIGRTSAEPGAQPPGTRIAAEDKTFCTLAAESALAGYELIDEVGIDGTRRFHVVRNGQVQQLDNLDAARAHLERIH